MDESIKKQFMVYMVGQKNKKPSTVATYISRVELFQKYYPNIDIVKQDDIVQYLSDMKIKQFKNDNTRRLSQTALISFFEWYAKRTGMQNPAVNLKPIHAYFSHPKLINPDELQRMLHAMEQRMDDWGRRACGVLVLLAETGIRIGEFEKLKVGNVRIEKDHFELIVPAVKTNYERIVPFGHFMAGSLVELFAKYYLWLKAEKKQKDNQPLFFKLGSKYFKTQDKQSEPLTRKGVDYLIRKAAYYGSVDRRISVHQFRHFFGTYSYINNKDIVLLSKLMGHSGIGTTQKYVHIANLITGESLRNAPTKGVKATKANIGYIDLLKDLLKNKK